MNYKNVMAANALMAFLYGFGSLLLPVQFWGIFGMDAAGEAIWGLRDAGVLVISNFYLVWMSRGLADSAGRKLIANFVVIVWALFGLVSLWGQFSGDFNAMNWANVVGAAFFAIITYMVRNDAS